MKKFLILLLTSSVLFSACGSPKVQNQTEGVETEEVSTVDTETATTYPLYITTMTHMEGNWNDDTNEQGFLNHVDQLRYGMDLAEEYNAILTVESEKPFARANVKWDLNIMQEVLDRGHGVGTHCDVGGPNGEKLDPAVFAEELKENKDLVDALVGADNNHGCSGAGGYSDWAQAAQIAGFDYLDGMVAMRLLAVPEKERPDPWTNRYILNDHYHDSFPEDIVERSYLVQYKNTLDMEPDDEGVVASNGEMGRFDALAESAYANEDTSCPQTGCPMTMEDVDKFVELVNQVNEERDPTKIAKLTFYFPSNTFIEENETVLRAFFEAAKKLQDEGKIQWASQWEVVQTYLDSLEK